MAIAAALVLWRLPGEAPRGTPIAAREVGARLAVAVAE